MIGDMQHFMHFAPRFELHKEKLRLYHILRCDISLNYFKSFFALATCSIGDIDIEIRQRALYSTGYMTCLFFGDIFDARLHTYDTPQQYFYFATFRRFTIFVGFFRL